ncbi:hypothetical protein GALMADRAFT_252297 [Galerina marginata CBS 339.88]|uniref:F-box domain-containing protein n=1 Tax=Galerina marginata (strain CBS 339.88) TaxID=685588 RepID=A0A067SPV5_GALM3|nr:hypothetical protein GALMADRAFT_252297 [Galerina marginata CBS 339.88]
MSQETQSPISKLHVELLWSIFLINTHPRYGDTFRAWTSPTIVESKDRPLTVIRRSSQVCKKWRDIILGAPALWGKVIDISLLCRLATEDWMNEVIRRSRGQWLYIATDNYRVLTKPLTLVKLLDDHWERIRALKATVRTGRDQSHIVEQLSQILRRPNKSIQSFKLELRFSLFGERPILDVEPPLFANSAPSLTAFHCANSFLNLDSPSPWFFQLRTLHIALEAWTYKIPQVLKALEGIPALETFTLSGENFHSDVEALPKNSIALPKLKALMLNINYIMTVKTVLDTLFIPPDCNFMVLTKYMCQAEDALDLSDACQTFHRFAQKYSNAYNTTSILLSISPAEFKFRDICPFPGASDFALEVSSSPFGEFFTPDCLSCLLSSFADCRFDKVDYMDLHLPSSGARIAPDDPNLVRFLSGLSSLTTMGLIESTLEFFVSYKSVIDPRIFSNLNTLMCDIMPLRDMSAGALLPFLKWRRDASVPIRKLDLTELDFTDLPQDLDFLEEMADLTVVWCASSEEVSHREYLCGSGNPGVLVGMGSVNTSPTDVDT